MKHLKIFKFFLCLIALIALERFCHSQTGGFCLSKATTAHKYPFLFSTYEPPTSLNQPFYFLGSGVQFYVFVGEDRQTILKLFKHHHTGCSIDMLKTLLPKRLASPLIAKRENRMRHLFNSAQIAFEQLSEQTGVTYTHLNKTKDLLGTIQLYDKLHIAHPLKLDQTEFILQRRAAPASQKLDTFFRLGQIDEAIHAIEELLSLIENRSKKGIKNKDGKVLKNCGYISNHPIEIDIGSYVMRTHSHCPNPHQKAKLKATLQVLSWVKRRYPQHLQETRERLLHENAM